VFSRKESGGTRAMTPVSPRLMTRSQYSLTCSGTKPVSSRR